MPCICGLTSCLRRVMVVRKTRNTGHWKWRRRRRWSHEMTCEKNDAGGGQAGIPGAALAVPASPAAPGTGAEPEEKEHPGDRGRRDRMGAWRSVAVALRRHLA